MRALGAAFVLATVAATSVACGKKLAPAVPLRPPVATTDAATKKPTAQAAPRPAPLPGVSLGSFGEGTFGPRVARNGAIAIVVSAPRSASGRRWMTVALDERDAPIADARNEVAEAPEDASAWDVKPVSDGFVLAWTKPTDAGEVLQVVSLAADGAPRGVPVTVAKSGDDLVAVRIVPAPAGTNGALLTFGERTLPKGATAAVGALFAVALDALGRPIGAPTKIEERLSAWQVSATSPTSAVAVVVQRVDAKPDKGDKGDKPKKDPDQLVAHHEIARAAKAIGIAIGPKGVAASDPVLLAGDEVVPEIEVVSTAPGRALAIWSDRRGVDAQLWSVALDVSGPKPKPLASPRRALPPRGDQAIVSVAPLRDGAAVLYELVSPRSIREPWRRFQIARLSSDGESVATPRAFWFPYEGEEPELARAGDDDVAVLTYGAACMAEGDAAPTCDRDDLRPFVVRFSGPTLAPKSADLLDTGPLTGGTPKHAFDLACRGGVCSALVEGPGPETIVALAKTPGPAPKPDALRWVYRELVDAKGGPPRLEGAGAIGREAEFTGLHAVRAGQGALVGWITYAPDDADVEPGVLDKGKKGKAKEPKKKADETGARVAVRLVDAGGEPLGPIAAISERALSKGDVAVAWSAVEGQGGVVAYVSRAEGDEEVYVARVDKAGKKAGSSTRITNAPGAASDVALAALPEGGYLLAWIDGRKGAPAVWAVRLDKGGAKVGAEVRIGGGQGGDLSDLALATIGSGAGGARVAAVWSDARDGGPHGFADVWYAVLSAKDLAKPVSPEKPLAKTKTHSHGPAVAARGDGGAIVAWLEDDPTSSEFLEYVGKSGWGPSLARIDANGAIAQVSTEVAIDPSVGKGVATSVAAECPTGPSSCRLAIAWAAREGVVVLGASGTQAGFAQALPIWSWYGAPSQEVAPAIVGHSVFLAEDGLEKDDGRVRRLSVTW